MIKPLVIFIACLIAFANSNAQISYWSEVGGQSPLVNTQGTSSPLCSYYEHSTGNLFVSYEINLNQLGLSLWNGATWTKYITPLTFDNALNPVFGPPNAITSDQAGNIYIAGDFNDDQGNFVVKFDGTNWTRFGTPPYASNQVTSIYYDIDYANLYIAGIEDTIGRPYVAEWNNGNWVPVGQPLPIENYQGSPWPSWPTVFAIGGYPYVTAVVWDSTLGFANTNMFTLYGNSWQPLDRTGLGYDNTQFMYACQGPYAGYVWAVNNQALNVQEWNGLTWNVLGTGSNALTLNPPFSYDYAGPAISSICVDNSANVYIAGEFEDAQGYQYVAKWNGTNWSELGINNFALHANGFINSIASDALGNVYACGSFTDGQNHPYVAEYSPLPVGRLFAFLSATQANCGNTGSINTTIYNGIAPYTYHWSNGATTANINTLGSGQYYVTVTDINGLVANADIYVPGGCQNIISGTVFVDTAGTCIYNGQQPVIPNVILTLSGDSQTLYATTDAQGNYSFAVGDTGNYHLYIQVGNNRFCGNLNLCGNPTQIIHVAHFGDTVSRNNFALIPDTTSYDLYLHPGWTSADPGFEKDYWIYFANNSPVPFSGQAILSFKYDSNLVFIGSDSAYTYYNAATDSISWTVSNFNNQAWNFIGRIRFTVPATLPLGYQLRSQFWIKPTNGDCDSSNNYLSYSESVKGSLDPNYKEVSPPANVSTSDSVLTYTIHFQNTGTDSTYFITVTDTLSPYLDAATVRNLASSVPYTSFSISGAGLLTWLFEPYSLVDSTTNPSGSKGFLTFSVKKRDNIPTGAYISNEASVYFDYNTPVNTNRVVDSVVSCTIFDTVHQTICQGTSYNGYTLTGTYIDTFTVSNGCDSIRTLHLTVIQPLTSSRTASTCAGVPYNFNGRNVTTAGTYLDTLHSIETGCDSIVTLTLTVNQPPVVTLYWDSMIGPEYFFAYMGDTVYCHELTNMVPMHGGNPWGGVYTGPAIINNIFYADSALNYLHIRLDTITYTYTDSNGCAGSAWDTVGLYNCLGIQQITSNNLITIYPNPATDQLFIKTENIQPQTITIYDVDGRKISTQPFTPQININPLSNGVYFIEVNSKEGVARKRFVKM